VTRIALYCHDALGLGHIRRTLLLAGALSKLAPRPDILVLSGAQEALALPRPPGCDVLRLPGLVKQGRERYAARDLSGIAPAELRALRSSVAAAALTSFAPDLLVVDRHPRGVGGELEAALMVRAGRSTVVLGLRDVLDDPAAAAQEWFAHRCAAALDAWYDAVWVYGDRRVYDVTRDIVVPPRLREAVHFTGYLAHGRDERTAPVGARRTVLGLVGGGADGAELARAFIAAAPLHGRSATLVLGPQMPLDDRTWLHAAARDVGTLRVLDFVRDMGVLLDRARAVVAMAGYNTACEILDRQLPTLMVPRVTPRLEQLVRAARLEDHGLVTLLRPGDLTPQSVASWIASATSRAGRGPLPVPQLDGLSQVNRLAAALLEERRAPHVAV
jgi:predicted glycosyltransferase